jgi:hypothetical protein
MNQPSPTYAVPSVSITTACTGASSRANEMGMRVMQARAYAKRGEQYRKRAVNPPLTASTIRC